MSFVVLIPARMSSSRLPNKPLADLGGVPMVVRVAKQARLSQAQRVIIAAQDRVIVDVAQSYDIEAVTTSDTHQSGTDRLAEVCQLLALPDHTVVVNVQGDEPFIEPNLINETAALVLSESCQMATAAHPINNRTDFMNPNVVKLVLNELGHADYFSRAPIPWPRDVMNLDEPARNAALDRLGAKNELALRHIGIYAYRVDLLKKFSRWPTGHLEKIEALEQLRVLEKGAAEGICIGVHLTQTLPLPGIDTSEDLEQARRMLAQQKL
jgi:3-deoxy-manno-octulosonate cytidylyltransferase (CMP-KDO synthetase)